MTNPLQVSLHFTELEKYLPLRPVCNASEERNQKVQICCENLKKRPASQHIFQNCNIIEGKFTMKKLKVELVKDKSWNRKHTLGFVLGFLY